MPSWDMPACQAHTGRTQRGAEGKLGQQQGSRAPLAPAQAAAQIGPAQRLPQAAPRHQLQRDQQQAALVGGGGKGGNDVEGEEGRPGLDICVMVAAGGQFRPEKLRTPLPLGAAGPPQGRRAGRASMATTTAKKLQKTTLTSRAAPCTSTTRRCPHWRSSEAARHSASRSAPAGTSRACVSGGREQEGRREVEEGHTDGHRGRERRPGAGKKNGRACGRRGHALC